MIGPTFRDRHALPALGERHNRSLFEGEARCRQNPVTPAVNDLRMIFLRKVVWLQHANVASEGAVQRVLPGKTVINAVEIDGPANGPENVIGGPGGCLGLAATSVCWLDFKQSVCVHHCVVSAARVECPVPFRQLRQPCIRHAVFSLSPVRSLRTIMTAIVPSGAFSAAI
jgi:hypothetical protein